MTRPAVVQFFINCVRTGELPATGSKHTSAEGEYNASRPLASGVLLNELVVQVGTHYSSIVVAHMVGG